MIANATTYSDVWQNCLAQIKEQTSEEEFAKWFKPIVPIGYDGKTLRLRLPSEDCVFHIERNYIPSLRPIIYAHFGNNTSLRYSVLAPEPSNEEQAKAAESSVATINKVVNQTDTTKIKNPFVIPGIRKLEIPSQLNPNYTFENFIEGDCNRLVRSVGMAIGVEPGKTAYNPLYIFGDSGLGKTHLAQAIGLEVKQRFPHLQVLYVSMNKFQAQYTRAVLNKEVNDFIHFYQMIDVLIVDDIQELSGKPSTQNAFFNIFNHLQLANKQLIMTSDKPPVELKDIEQRLLTRFKWGLSGELGVPDIDTKIKIIRLKVNKMGIDIPEDVITFLAENITANVREIEGALASLVANAQFLGKRITPALAKEILKVYVQFTQKEITIEHIKEVVCECLGITTEAFESPRRTREIAHARQIAMYLSKKHTKSPLTTIGAAIGGKNHATVLHSCKQISNELDTDKVFRAQMEEIERKVLA